MTITSTEQFTALADGATIRVRDETWTRTGNTWTSGLFSLPSESFTRDVAAGRVALSEAAVSPARSSHGFTVGQPINTYEQLQALPIGTTVGPNEGEAYRIEEGGVRSVQENYFHPWATRALSMGGYNHILSLPESASTVGQPISTYEQFAALPVGTTVRYQYRDHAGHVYAKGSDGWYDVHGERFATSDVQAASVLMVGRGDSYRVTVESLPETTPEFTVGQRLNQRAQRDALPVGSRLRYGANNGEFALKGADGVWRFDGEGDYAGQTGTYGNSALNLDWYLDRIGAPESSTGLWTIDQTFATAEEVAALPVGAELQYRNSRPFRKMGPNDWRMVGEDGTVTGGQNSDGAFAGGTWRLVHLPEPVVTAAPGVTTLTADTGTVTVTPTIQGLDPERVQEMLHGYLHDHGGLDQEERDGIFAVLDSLGLEHPAPEQEEVEVEVNVSGDWTEYHDGIFQDAIGGSVTVDNSHLTCHWTNTVTVTVTVDEGDCACEEVTEEQVKAALREDGMDSSCVEDSDLDLERSCPNC